MWNMMVILKLFEVVECGVLSVECGVWVFFGVGVLAVGCWVLGVGCLGVGCWVLSV